MKKALVFLANGFEEIEAVTAIDYLRRAGADVAVAATGTSSTTVTGAHKVAVVADCTLDSYLPSTNGALPDVVVVPGGMPGASNIASCQEAIDLIKNMGKQKRLIAAICAAPAVVLPETGVLLGYQWTCYPGMKNQAGGYASTEKDDVPFVTDRNLITGRGPGAAEEFAMEIVRVLFGNDMFMKIRTGACQR